MPLGKFQDHGDLVWLYIIDIVNKSINTYSIIDNDGKWFGKIGRDGIGDGNTVSMMAKGSVNPLAHCFELYDVLQLKEHRQINKVMSNIFEKGWMINECSTSFDLIVDPKIIGKKPMRKDRIRCRKCNEVKSKRHSRKKYVNNIESIVCCDCAKGIDKQSGGKARKDKSVKVSTSVRVYAEDKVKLVKKYGSFQSAIDHALKKLV